MFVDYDLLLAMARARPHWSWVFVGPITAAIGDLVSSSNVHLLGHHPHDELASLLRMFDVCLVPYLVNASTATIVPAKINEYLAMGKPIVSTRLPTVCDFNRNHDVLLIADSTLEAFVKVIDHALQSSGDQKQKARRREVVALNDWEVTITRMNTLIESRLHQANCTQIFCGSPKAMPRSNDSDER